MHKVLSLLAALWISAIIGQKCEYQMELWAAEDPTKFYYCDPNTNTRAIGDCMPNTGFVRNDTVTGCIPWDSWKEACVSKSDVSTFTCGGTTYLQPSGAANPRVFYLCIEKDTAPVQLQCAADRGFYSDHKFLGCIPWGLWRNLTGCIV